MFGKLKSDEIEEVFHHNFLGRLGCHADNMTYVVPISYGYDGKYVYGHANEGLTVKMMRKNPEVCFEVETMENMANWKTVIGWGTFEQLDNREACREAADVLNHKALPFVASETAHLSPDWPFTVDVAGVGGVFFRILLHEKTGRFETPSMDSCFAS